MLVIANPDDKKVRRSGKDMAGFKFNYQGAVDYARANVENPNEFDQDCTNFVSKCWLKGGQVPEDPGGWFNHDMDKPNTYQHTDHMAAWTSAPDFKSYMFNKGYVEIVQDSVAELHDTETNETKQGHLFFAYASLGDVIQLCDYSGEPYHSMLITKLIYDYSAGAVEIRLTYHTSNRIRNIPHDRDCSLAEKKKRDKNTASYEGYL